MMGIDKNKLNNAFREVLAKEFCDVPPEESIDFTFSKHFLNEINKISKMQNKPYLRIFNFISKKAMIACVSIIVALSTLFSISAIREPIIGFVVEVYETFVRYVFGGEDREEIDYEYSIGEIPEGFVEHNTIRSDISVLRVYENEEGDVIEYHQSVSYNSGHTADLEKGEVYSTMIKDTEVSIYDGVEVKEAIWTKDDYVMRLVCYGNISIDTVRSMIESIK